MRRVLCIFIVVMILASVGRLLLPSARERQLTQRIATVGGTYGLAYVGPAWPPDIVVHWRLFCRPSHIYLEETTVDDRDLESLTGMTQIEHIDLTDTRISDDGLFSKEPLTGSGDNSAEPVKREHALPWLRSMQALYYIDVRETKVTADGLKRLCKAFPRMQILPEPEIDAALSAADDASASEVNGKER